jgi:hypothetical protein
MKRLLLIAFITLSINAIAQTNTFPTNGNVGIGTTNPSSPLHILTNNSLETNILTLHNTSPWSNGQIHNIVWRDQVDGVTGAIGMQYDRNGNVDFKIHSLYNGNYKNSSVTSFIVKGNGNVGIGTIQPSDKLQIGDFNNGNNSKICIPGVYNFEQVRLGQYGNGACGLEFINHASLLASYGIRLLTDIDHFYGLQIQMATPANSYNELNYKTQFAITTNGNVGIGTTNPEAPLEIKSQTPHRGLIISRENLNTKIYLHVAEGNYGYLDLGGNTQLRGNGGVSYFDGSLGIGTTNPDQKLTVKGKIHAEEVIIDLAVPADYVFKPNYKLLPLSQVEKFVKMNSHLPEIPSAYEITKNGMNMGEMQNKLLQKVEELTLYAIQQDKSKIELERKYNVLLEKVEMLTKQLEKK